MKFDTIIMGGGLSGLTCGIALAKKGRRVAIVAGGQNTLHFFSGSMELLGCVNGQDVTNPIEAIASLDGQHPYSKIGADHIGALAQQAQVLLGDAGIKTVGDATRNHYRITPIGVTKPAWLTVEGLATTSAPDSLPWKKVCLVNLEGFIDYPIDFVANGLRELGAQVEMPTVSLDCLKQARRSATEMRATNLAKVFANTSNVARLADAINAVCSDAEAVLMPAVLGYENDDVCSLLKAQVKTQLYFLATLPPAVTGVRINASLKHYFQMLGGRFLMGDSVENVAIDGDTVTHINTTKLQAMPLQADNYVLATGSFMSRGLAANFERIYEPLMDLDTDAPQEREQWSKYGMMGDQPYMGCGVVTDGNFHPLKDGKPLTNVYAIGQVLGGHNPLTMGDGTVVSMLTALAVANDINS
ncbi:MAG: glycerol-3-phosphate dehydrogenase subunit GlpB [Muribaculaceae bacterium]|nr:glycerol-3-phosphate dehydrogenase subunit GlpB [Muribaculaceae bacterium]